MFRHSSNGFKRYTKHAARIILSVFSALTLLLTLSPAVPLSAQEEVCAKREIVYALLHADGSTGPLIVVNHYRPKEACTITDYGDYSEVKRLIGNGKLEQDGDKITAEATPGEWYYQGVLKDRRLPWIFHFDYELDGRKVTPEELSGANGKLSFKLTIKQDPETDEAFRKAFFLQISIGLNNDSFTGLDAPGALQAVAGKKTLVNYFVFPEDEHTISFTADIQNFSMEAPQISALPMNFDSSALDLDGKKALEGMVSEDEKEQMSKAEDGIQQLADGAEKLRKGSASIAEGITKLSEAGEQLKNEGTAQISEGLAKLGEGTAALKKGAKEYFDGTNQLSEGGGGLDKGITSLAEGIKSMSDKTGELEKGISGIKDGLSQLSSSLQEKLGGASGGKEAEGTKEGAATAAFDPAAAAAEIDNMIAKLDQLAPLLSTDVSDMQAALQSMASISWPGPQTMQQMSQALSPESLAALQQNIEQSILRLAAFNKEMKPGTADAYMAELHMLEHLMAIQSNTLKSLAASLGQVQGAMAGFSAVTPEAVARWNGLLEQFRTLQTSYGTELPAMREKLEGYKQMLSQLGQEKGGIAEQLQQLSSGVTELDKGMSELSEGLTAFFGGLHDINDKMPELQEGAHKLAEGIKSLSEHGSEINTGIAGVDDAVKQLSEGFTKFADGQGQLADGLAELSSKYKDFDEGVAKLADGTAEFQKLGSGLTDFAEGKIDELIDKFLPEYVSKSFVSDKNKNVESLQFVLMGPAVPKPKTEEKETTSEDDTNKDFWQRLKDLF